MRLKTEDLGTRGQKDVGWGKRRSSGVFEGSKALGDRKLLFLTEQE